MSWANRKTSRQDRGYGRAWEVLRAQILKRDNNLCQCAQCKAEDRTALATEVDHIIPKAKGGTDEPSNLQAINHHCHLRKSIEDQGGKMRPRMVVGIDGYPRNGGGV